MPAFAAHYFFSVDVLKKLDEETKERVEKYLSYFTMGAQGPDIYYYYKPYKANNISDYGSELHRTKFKKTVEEAVKRIKEYDDEGALIYLLGVSTHFTLDNALHKLINKQAKNKNEHMLIETDFEHFVLMNHLKKYKPHKFRRALLISYPGGKKKCYGSQINLVFPKVDIARSNEVIYQLDFYLGHLYSPNMIKGKLIKFLSKKFVKNGSDFSMMIIKKEPSHQYDDLIKKLDEKYEESVDQAVANIKNIIEYYENDAKLNNIMNQDFL